MHSSAGPGYYVTHVPVMFTTHTREGSKASQILGALFGKLKIEIGLGGRFAAGKMCQY